MAEYCVKCQPVILRIEYVESMDCPLIDMVYFIFNKTSVSVFHDVFFCKYRKSYPRKEKLRGYIEITVSDVFARLFLYENFM